MFDKQIGSPDSVGVRVSVDGVPAGRDNQGGAGAQGVSPNPDYLWIDSLPVRQSLTAGAHSVKLDYSGSGSTHAKIDAILLQPVIESKVLDDGNGATLAAYKSLSDVESQVVLPMPAREWAVLVYDRNGKLVDRLSSHPNRMNTVPVRPFGYTIASGE